jgi:predicted phage baseplate assembly protein
MTIPAPNLDDRRFQDLVDDAKRYVQQRCPEWSDHNVSDPGVTLIETFAMTVDQLLYRLNRVPDRLYLRFLELLGVTLFPPTPAMAAVTFWLSAPQPETVTVRAGSEVATKRTEDQDALAFVTAEDLAIVTCGLIAIATVGAERGAQPVDRTDDLQSGDPFRCFSAQPVFGDALLIGLSAPIPRCVVALRFDCQVEGVGVDPRNPPLIWEAWNGSRWEACELDSDGTGGLNRPGDVVLHVPASHTRSGIVQRPAGWLRCRVLPVGPDQPFYNASPRIHGASAFTLGGTIDATYSEVVVDESVGVSEGVPGQRFPLARRPIVAGDPILAQVSTADGWQDWIQVEHFGDSGPEDDHFVLDLVAGHIVFGPAVRQADGTARQYGAVPPKSAAIRVPRYQVGGGGKGNVARGEITALRASVPYVARVENRRPAAGGVDGENVESARRRAPLFLRSRDRAVTEADYEYLGREADPRVARTSCRVDDGSTVRLVVVPVIPGKWSQPLQPAAAHPSPELLDIVTRYLDERRMIGTRLLVERPNYRWITAVATVVVSAGADRERVSDRALEAIYSYLHPLRGGIDGDGWPFGRAVPAGELLAAVARIPGVAAVEEVKLYPVDPRTGQRSEGWTNKIDLVPGALPFSFEHVVDVVAE